MSTTRVSTIAALLVSLAVPAVPASAQGRGWGDGQEAQPRSGGERRRSNGGGEGRQGGNREGGEARQRGERSRPEADRGGNDNNQRQAEPRREAVPRGEVYRNDRGRDRDDSRRVEPQRRDNDRDRDRDRNDYRRYDGGRDRGRDYRYVPVPRGNRYSYPPRTYVVPYGYRPQGYRSDWSVNLYFGRPYRTYPGYYGRGSYGYFDIYPGLAYGSLRIVDAPRDAQVFVDGYYAGVVDDYDGVFQRLNLEPGGHQIEIDVYPGVPPMDFDVYIEPGRTVTIHARP